MQRKLKLAITANGLSLNGITKVIIGYATRLPRNEYHIVVFNSGKAEHSIVDCLAYHGIDLKDLPRKERRPLRYFTALVRELHAFDPDIVHINGSSALMAPEMLAAFLSRTKVRIAHCHSSRCNHPILNFMFKPMVRALSTNRLACSRLAGESVFRRGTFDVLPNAFEVTRFAYDEQLREKVRAEYGIPADAFALGHVGRINDVKNQRFAVDVFDELCRQKADAYIVFVGKGPGMAALRERVEASPNGERIILAGDQPDPAPFYSAFDALLFPSRYEGLGITVLEAQACGLPCFISSSIPEEADVGGRVTRISISESARKWADTVLGEALGGDIDRMAPEGIAKYDIARCVESLAAYYFALNESPLNWAKRTRLVMR